MATRFRIHLLDMGNRDYGDCIVVEIGSRKILIDGGHPDDDRPRTGFRPLPRQMASVLGRQPPFNFDLLIVTHCHNDHIGCLPEMVASGTIRATWALVADPDMGWGISNDGDDPFAVDDPVTQQVLAGLREEPPLRLSDKELADFLDVVGRLQDRYRQMLVNLDEAGTRVVRCGRDDIAPLLAEFQNVGLRYLGPSSAHLAKCTAAIAGFGRDSRDTVADAVASDAAPDAVKLFRQLLSSGADAEDRRGLGAALNDQSIIVTLEADGKRALFTGDMQFAKPEVEDLDDDMAELRERISQRAPYHFVKISHHASYNAFDQSVLDELGESLCYGISTGRGDEGHPERSVLDVLRAHRNEIRWARTDRNGLVTFNLSGATPRISCERGSPNNGRINSDEATPEPAPGRTLVPRTTVVRSEDDRFVEVIAKVPHVATKVTLTIEIEPREAPPPEPPLFEQPPPAETSEEEESSAGQPPRGQPDLGPFRLAGGRTLPKLLFVTNRGRLMQNIGAPATETIINKISQAGHPVLHSLPAGVAAAAQAVRASLQQHSGVRGVVLIGGYDVVPPQKLDALDADLRRRLRGMSADGDNFIVWSDAIYGDNDGDAEQELPVSRIPDGKSAALVLAALQATPPTATRAFGIRNLRRPFAEEIWDKLSSAPLRSCDPYVAAQVQTAEVGAAGRLYFMLHGDDDDTTRFWGESAGGGYPEAFNVGLVPARSGAVLLTGCCWGALTAKVTARRHIAGQPIAVHTPQSSLALAFLRAGVQAFVGCTGSHYSPTVSPYGYFGGPMHAAFWHNVLPAATGGKGMAPAEALWNAKRTYLAGMPHGQTSPNAVAIEQKIFHQFHCLGLGW